MEVVLLICLGLLLLFLFLIAPRVFSRPDRTPFMKVYYAHRGLHDNHTKAPENSMAAFQKAIDAGYGIELDVRLTRDSVPVIFHDASLNRACGEDKKVCDLTYEELRQFKLFDSEERIPRFEDFLQLADGKVPLIIEWKLEDANPQVCRVCQPLLNAYQGPYCIESFNPAALIWYRRHEKKVLRGQLSMEFTKEKSSPKSPVYFCVQHLLSNFLTRPDFIAYDHHGVGNLSRRICTRFFKALSVAWTIKSQQELEKARENFSLFIFDSFIPQ